MDVSRTNDRRVKENLIEAALAEFSEKGYDEANLREICAKARVTTGALYFFFKNKADLYEHAVEPTVKALEKYEHLVFSSGEPFSDEDLKEVADFIYENQTGLKLLLCGSEKTEYANYNEKVINNAELILKKVAYKAGITEFTDEFTSVVAKCAEATVKDLVSHDYDKDTLELLVRKIYTCIEGILNLFVDYKKEYLGG